MRPILLHKRKYELIRELNNLRTVVASLEDINILSMLSGEMTTGIAGLFGITIKEVEELYINIIARNIGEMQVSIDINDVWSIHLDKYTAVLGKRAWSILERFLVKVKKGISKLTGSYIKYINNLDAKLITSDSKLFESVSNTTSKLLLDIEDWYSQTVSSSVKYKSIINTTFKLMDGLRYIFVNLQDKLITIKANIKLLSPYDYIRFSGFSILGLLKIESNIVLFNNIRITSNIDISDELLIDLIIANPEVNSYYDLYPLNYLYPLTLGEMSVNFNKQSLIVADTNIDIRLFSKIQLGYFINAYNNISLNSLDEYTLNYLSKH